MLMVLALLAVGSSGAGDPPSGARFTTAVPADVRALAVRVSADVSAALPARAGCVDGATIDTDRALSDRARYHPATATVVLRIPATAAQLEMALIHELAHHVEHVCPSHAELRPAFLAAQRLPAGGDWFDGGRWEDTPSEQYAEAMVVHVRGRRSFHRQVPINAAAVAALAQWAGCRDHRCAATARR